MSDDQQHTRSIDLSIEVPGTPEEVWQAIASGPGIGSWFVPTEIDEREGGRIAQHFGPGMDAEGQVTAWEPPRRFAFGAADGSGLAFEWLVEARDGGSCVVRLVNSGFGTGEPWDDQYDSMTEGWRFFLANLQLHLTHFPGRRAASALPMAVWGESQQEAWDVVAETLGLTDARPGATVASGGDAPSLRGTVVEAVVPHHVTLLLTEPAQGTALFAAEHVGPAVGVSTWLYLYGDDAAALAEREGARWREWLDRRAVPME
ncbi:MAG: SRPBCC domain-containing protein [Nocardioidaceae bacterium]